jgi:hypothetical protein
MQSKKIQEEFKKTKGVVYYYYDDRRKIEQSQKEIDRIIDYGSKHGFVDPGGKSLNTLLKNYAKQTLD